MPSPIRPSEICSLVPSGTSSLCDRILKVFLQLPAKFCALATWMFNEDGTLTDTFIREVAVIPVGTVIASLTTVVPAGWLACNGQEVSRETYADLFGVIGTIYGSGNGTTTFNLPNLQDKFLYGKGSTSSVGDTGGEATHVLTVPEMPSHTHSYITLVQPGDANNGGANGVSSTTSTTNPTGGDQPHNNIPPFVRVAFLVKY